MEFATFLIINIIRIYKGLIIARVLLSWVQGPGSRSKLTLFINQTTEPVLRLFRSILPRTGMIDLSPLIAFIALDFLQLALLRGLTELM